MGYLTEFLRRQIVSWQGVLARADPEDKIAPSVNWQPIKIGCNLAKNFKRLIQAA
ncbi:hypothetical protein [Alysiella crassa]|uniref:Uncharacterized protein n=1 Tax=Alysiella crassa TaxID=153491 RepID=A0A376BTY2_9NEIS|nr:hypothetical protein [Alysiella crassa]UOP05874.1 hypothetical protein LVJ80_08260 [Alysiella crassa]SSY80301.1 Uncharacterised protein [Alysiella crassa]